MPIYADWNAMSRVARINYMNPSAGGVKYFLNQSFPFTCHTEVMAKLSEKQSQQYLYDLLDKIEYPLEQSRAQRIKVLRL